MLNSPWIIAIVAPLIVALVVAFISKRDLVDREITLKDYNDYCSGIIGKLSEKVRWGRLNDYLAKKLIPAYYYPYKLWFRQRLIYGDAILVYKTNNSKMIEIKRA